MPGARRLLRWGALGWAVWLAWWALGNGQDYAASWRTALLNVRPPYDWSGALATWGRHLRGAAGAALWLVTAAGWGALAARPLRVRSALTAFGLGLTALGLAVLGAGTLGLLRAPVFIVLAVVGVPGLAEAWGWRDRLGTLRPRGAAAVAASLTTVILLAATLGPALAPELGWDAMTYHLRVPTHDLARGKLYVLPFSLGSFYPFLCEQWFLPALWAGGVTGAKLLNWAFLPLTVAGLVRLAAGAGERSAGWVGALVLVSSPAFEILSGQSYNDLAVAAFSLLALRAALRPGAGARVASAVLCGACLGIKYTGAWMLPICAALWIRRDRRAGRPWPLALRDAAVAGAAAVAVFAPWPWRDWAWTGNPVYPLAPGWFPRTGWNPYISPADAVKIVPVSAPARPLQTLLALVRFPLDFSRDITAVAARFSPLFVGLVAGLAGEAVRPDPEPVRPARPVAPPPPAALPRDAKRKPARVPAVPAATTVLLPAPPVAEAVWISLAAGAVSAGLWVVTRASDGRYLLPVAALLAVPAGVGATRAASGSWLRGALLAALVAACLPAQGLLWLAHVGALYAPWRVAVGAEPREVYLSRAMLPNHEYYPMARRVNALLPPTARVLMFSDIVSFYMDPEVIFDTQQINPPVGQRLFADCRSPQAQRKRFRQLGIGYVLYTARTLMFERACHCLALPPGPRECSRAFWKRYEEPVTDVGSLRLLRLRSEAVAARSKPGPFLCWPGVQDVAMAAYEDARSAGKAKEAVAALQPLVALAPDLADARMKLAEAYLLAGDTPRAAAQVREARRLGEDTGAYWLLEAGARTSLHDYPGALAAVKKGAELWPAPRPYALLAAYAHNAGDDRLAHEAIGKALALNPYDADVRKIASQLPPP